MGQELVREELLIVGLGNPESDYADTRHNLGFACVRELGRRLGIQIDRKRWQSLVGHSEASGIWLVLPQTFMNLSGQPVAKAVRDRKRGLRTPLRVGHGLQTLTLSPERSLEIVHDARRRFANERSPRPPGSRCSS